MEAPGHRADLILSEENPLAALSTLRAPLGVMVKGQWRDAAALMRTVRAWPPWCDADARPGWLDAAMEILEPRAQAPPAEPSVILTVWGAGYKAADV